MTDSTQPATRRHRPGRSIGPGLRRGLAAAAAVLALAAAASAAILPPSARPGMGAIPYSDAQGTGCTFRVWAPNATSVSVVGNFNFWNPTLHVLSSEGNGLWSGDVVGVIPGIAQYKFSIKNGSTTLQRNDPMARDLTNSAGNSVVYNPNAYVWQQPAFQSPPWNELVIYEMHVGTFNVPQGGSPPSGWNAAVARLDHVKSLGANAVEIMPFAEFAADVSWGYNGSFPYAPESAYGSPDDLKAFVDQAHARGLAVIADVVYNHLGPSDLDLWQFDGWSQNGLGGIYFYNDSRAVTPWGDTRPDYGRGEVRQFLRDNALRWLGEFRMDGLRVDGTKFIRKVDVAGPDIPDGWSLLQWINDSVDSASPGKIVIAEDHDDNAWLGKPTAQGGAGFDSQWDVGFNHNVRDVLIQGSDAARDMGKIQYALTHGWNDWYLQRVIYTESHDEVANGHQRLPEEIWPGHADSYWSRKRSTLGAALVMTAPGIPMLFMGQEFLEDGWFAAEDPLDWSKVSEFPGILSLYKDLIALRRNLAGRTRGLTGPWTNVHHTNNSGKVVAFHRWQDGGAGDDVVVLCNFSNTTWTGYRIGLPRPGTWKVRFNSDWNGYSPDYQNTASGSVNSQAVPYDGMAQSGVFTIGPYTALIYSQSPGSAADINGDGTVDGADLGLVLSQWGWPGTADLDGSGVVNGADLGLLLASWGPVP